MSKYDKDREKLGLKVSTSSPTAVAEPKKESKYDKEREVLKTGKKPASEVNKVRASTIMDPIDFQGAVERLPKVEQGTRKQPILRGAAPTDIPLTEKQRTEMDKQTNKELRAGINVPRVNQVMNRVSEFVMQAGNAAALGIPLGVAGDQRADYERTMAGTLGGLAGEALPISKAYSLANLATKGIKGGLARTATRGGIVGTGYGLAKEAADVALDTRQDETQTLGERAKNVATEAALFAGGDVALSGIGRLAKKYTPSIIQSLTKRNQVKASVAPQNETVSELLALPAPRPRGNVNTAITPEVINAGGKIADPLALPASSYNPTKLKVSTNNEALDRVMTTIKPEVESIITPPARRDLLINYIQKNLDIPVEEIRNMPMTDLQELGQVIRQDFNVYEVAQQVSKSKGYNLDELLNNSGQNVSKRVAEDAQKRTYGVYDAPSVNLQYPEKFRTEVTGQAEIQQKVGFRKEVGPEATPSRYAKEREVIQQAKPSRYAEEREAIQVSPLRKQTLQGEVDELKFADTVKKSENTPDELTTTMKEKPMVGARTTDVLNRKQADELITKHGREGLYAKLLDKKLSLSPAESVAAQKLAKEYASKGGEANISKAIALVSKTAREGREMGQAIQALSQWNKLDETGALLMGQRQLNRGVTDTADWVDLTPTQAKPLEDAAEKFGMAKDTKSLADEVLSIVTNKQAGEALTESDKATIQKFKDQVKDIDSKVKGFLPKQQGKAQETIKKIREIEPKARTRDQVVNFLDAKAELARKRLEKSRNIGVLPDLSNPVTDYAIIGAAHIAKGIRNYADYAEMLVKDFGDSVKPHLKEAYTKSVNMFRREQGLPTIEQLDRVVNQAVKAKSLDKETADSLKAMASEIGFYTDKNLKLEATQDLQRALKELGTSTLGEKLSTIQTGAQLLNPVTIGRNVIGNTAQMATEKLNKMNAVPIDWALSKLTGERTIMFNPRNQEKMLANFMMGAKSGWEGVSPTGTLSSYDVRPDVFGKKNPLRYTTKGLGATLQSFDNVAYRAAYGDVVATYGEQLGKAQGLSKEQIKETMPKLIEQLDERIHEMADQAGLYATFQDETLLSKAADITKKGLNKITDYPMEKLVDMGVLPKKYSTQGFGLGDIVLKYARTPANLVMRGIDYSPLGFLRATMELAPLVFNKSKFNQFEATRALSRAITGTLGLTGMGYALHKAGVLTGSYSRDKDLRSIEEQSGQGSYKVNFSALGRFIMSGLDKDAAKFQKGDRMMDYQWLQPTAIALAIGVNFNKSLKEADPDTSGWQVIQRAILGGLSTVLENPMVQGLTNVIDAGTDIIKNQDTTKAKQIVKGVPTTFIPTLLGQARTATDNTQRETRDEKILTEMLNLIKNKLPIASKTLPVAYDSLGNERERLQGGKANTVGQYLKAFFSPAKFTKYEVSPEAKLVLDLLEESKDLKILPRMVDRTIEVNDPATDEPIKLTLTGKQYSDLQKSVGKKTTDMLREYEYFLADPKVSIEEKTAAMSKILTYVGQVARNEMRDSMGYRQKQMR